MIFQVSNDSNRTPDYRGWLIYCINPGRRLHKYNLTLRLSNLDRVLLTGQCNRVTTEEDYAIEKSQM